MQSLAWESGSSLYPLLVTAAGRTPPPLTPLITAPLKNKREPQDSQDGVGPPVTPEADPGARPRVSAPSSIHTAGEGSSTSGEGYGAPTYRMELKAEVSFRLALWQEVVRVHTCLG